MRGKFIVFEGIDGCGKSTQAKLLSQSLKSAGFDARLTAEPTDSPCGRLIREALAGRYQASPSELAALFLADRIHHNTETQSGIAAMLEDGVCVICDRYYYSSLAYQGMSADYGWVKGMNLNCPDIVKPDLCIFLDIPVDVSLSRIQKRGGETEIFEQKEALIAIRDSFFKVFFDLSNSENIKTVDASREPEAIANDVLALALDIINA